MEAEGHDDMAHAVSKYTFMGDGDAEHAAVMRRTRSSTRFGRCSFQARVRTALTVKPGEHSDCRQLRHWLQP
jgi:hypothetical protein